MGQKITIIKRGFWRRKTDGSKGIPHEQESVWADIFKRTVKTFLEVALGAFAASFAPDRWKATVTMAVSAGSCAAINYAIRRVQGLLKEWEPDYETREEDTDDHSEG